MDTFFSEELKAALEAEALQDWDLAERSYRNALALRPGDHRLLTNLSTVLWWADKPKEALPPLLLAASQAPHDWQPQRGLGNVLRDLNRWEEADQHYLQAQELEDSALTAWNRSQLLIGLEKHDLAYRLSERRLELEALEPYRANPNLRQGELFGERPLHIWSEQGLGDTLQYLRWLIPLCQRPGSVVLEVEPALQSLLERGLSWLKRPPIVVSKKLAQVSGLEANALHGSLLSLPALLDLSPISSSHYLQLPGPKKRPASASLRVGLVWAAGRKLEDPFTAREYRKRSLPGSDLGRLLRGLKAQGAELFNLQVGPDRSQAKPFQALWSGELPQESDFLATAKWIQERLDLVISVDTACAHLCGAIGFPCWLLLPWSADPRWLRQRQDSPWYPTLRLWRQDSPQNWPSAITPLLEGLKQQLAAGADW